MDPYSRRSTWNIIQRNKKGRIILLTTHFMDEGETATCTFIRASTSGQQCRSLAGVLQNHIPPCAGPAELSQHIIPPLPSFLSTADLLGDRVAIMAHGKLQCCGSPLFLKNQFGVGYTLTVVKHQHQPEAQAPPLTTLAHADTVAGGLSAVAAHAVERSRLIRELVQSFVEEAEPLSDVGAEQSFRLPFTASGQFVDLFRAFDEQKEELGIAEYGISVTTLEEVFIRVGEMEESINDLSEAEAGARAAAQQEAEEVARLNGDVIASIASPAALAGPGSGDDGAGASPASVSPPPLHGILYHDHNSHHSHHRARARSTSSEHLLHSRSSTTSVDHAHHGHKRVSFREGEDERPSLGPGHATVLTLPPPVKGKTMYVECRFV